MIKLRGCYTNFCIYLSAAGNDAYGHNEGDKALKAVVENERRREQKPFGCCSLFGDALRNHQCLSDQIYRKHP